MLLLLDDYVGVRVNSAVFSVNQSFVPLVVFLL